MDAATFRQHFPEFADAARYPDAQVQFWAGIGERMLNADRWAELLDHGLELFTAHHLVLAQQNQQAAATGAAPGASTGAIAGKTIDKVGVTYDTASAALEGAGHWNLTTYGTQYLQLSQMMGAGGLQL